LSDDHDGGQPLSPTITGALALRRPALGAILLLAAALRCWRLDTGGFIVPYYFAGVRSMLESWHNFLFNAFDPAGFVSLDKPPVAFWLQTLSAKLFGFGAVGVLLPQVLEGLAAILLVYMLVRRRFGVAAGLLAALFLALNPISVAVDRSNNTESCLVLTLLIAAWALSRAFETGRLADLLLSAVVVGVGFNVKMLVALGVVPAFILVYFVGANLPLRRRFGTLALAAVVLAAVSLSWSLVYELTPPQDRPFVDSTTDNSMLELVVGHNFIQRFIPRAYRERQTAPAVPAAANPTPDQAAVPAPGRDYAPAGPLRLAAPSLASQTGWLLPLALIGGMAAWLTRRRAGERLSLALWAGWAMSYGIVFSAAGGIFHGYYLAVMAPALCALAGAGAVALWTLYRAGGAWSLLLPGTIAATVLWQVHILDFYLAGSLAIGRGWLGEALAGIGIALAVGLVVLRGQGLRAALPLGAVALAVLVALPTAWSIGSGLVRSRGGFPEARPPFLNAEAESRRGRYAQLAGAIAGDPKLIAFLQESHGNEEYLLAAVNARQAAPINIATGDPVMALGGFGGGDPILTVEDFARLVAESRVRFALIGDGSEGLRRVFGENRQKPLTDWIQANGKPVDAALWRSPGANAERAAADGRSPRAAESVGTQLYDLRPASDAEG